MKKDLHEMNNEELWKLFPIIINEHDPDWKNHYEAEKTGLTEIIGTDNILRVNHIGSTCIAGLGAKPTIDILMEIKDNTNIQELISKMKNEGYIYLPQPKNPPPHLMFLKGYTAEGFKGQTFHIHFRFSGDWDELYFRDYLLENPVIAEEYGKLKLLLKQKYEFNRDAYTEAKGNFIKEITNIAKVKFSGRYKPDNSSPQP